MQAKEKDTANGAIVIGSSDDITHIIEELGNLTTTHDTCTDTVVKNGCIYYTQQGFENQANALQKDDLLVKKQSICLLVKTLQKKVCQISGNFQVILFNGNKPSNQATKLILSAKTA
ncbi:MAG: hypothetical protein PHT88_04185 [Candidatus Moranbacteria bacterium]|nr:hypothetical protein [Candidatus Moranbacteria bacterium]